MADEAETTNTETSATDQTDATTTNDVLESTALGDAGAPEAAAEEKPETEAASVEGEGDGSDPKDGGDGDEAKVPESYELTAPDGLTLVKDDIDAATPVFKELGLSNEQANKLMPVAAQFAQRIADRIASEQLSQVAEWRRERLDEAKSDPEVGGAKWDESIALSAKALDQFGAPKGSPFRTALDESGWGNHVEFVRMFAKIGRAIGEDGFARADATATKRSDAELFYPDMSGKGV